MVCMNVLLLCGHVWIFMFMPEYLLTTFIFHLVD